MRPPGAEADQTRREVGKIVRRRDDISPDVHVERRHQHGDQRQQRRYRLMKAPQQRDRRPDRLAKDLLRGRSTGDADERVQRHRNRQTKGLADNLRVLRFGIARKVGNVQRQRSPIANHRRQRRKEEMQKAAGRVEVAGRRKHRSEAACLMQHPEQQRKRHHQHEGRGEALQKADRLHPAPHHEHIEQPESEKARP